MKAKKKGKYGGYTRKTNPSPTPGTTANSNTVSPQKPAASSSFNATPSKPAETATGLKLPALNQTIDSDISRANLSATNNSAVKEGDEGIFDLQIQLNEQAEGGNG